MSQSSFEPGFKPARAESSDSKRLPRESGVHETSIDSGDVGRRLARLRNVELRDEAGHRLLRQLERQVEACGGPVSLRYPLAQLQARAGLYARALTQTSSALQAQPRRDMAARLWSLQGRVLLSRCNAPQALRSLERAYELDASGAAPHLIRALENYLAQLRNTLSGLERQRRPTLRLAELYRAHGSPAGAAELLARWIERAGPQPVPLQMLVDVLGQLERPRSQAHALLRLVQVAHGEQQWRAALELSLLQQHVDNRSLRRALEAAQRSQPQHEGLRQLLREHYATQGARREMARLSLQEARRIRDRGQRADQLVSAAEALVLSKDHRRAIEALMQALQLAPGHVGAASALSPLLLRQGSTQAARQLLQKSLRRPLSTADAGRLTHLLAHVELADGRPGKALPLLQKARSCVRGNPEILADMVRAALALELWDLADEALGAILSDRRRCSITRTEARVQRGYLALKRGSLQQAGVWARRVEQQREGTTAAAPLRKAIEEAMRKARAPGDLPTGT